MSEDIKEFETWLNAKDGKFYEMAREYIVSIGHAEERERLVELLEDQLSCSCETPVSHAIALIKGVAND